MLERMDLASRYHKKALEGEFEPNDSELKKACIEYLDRQFNFCAKEAKNYNVTWMCVSYWGLTNDFFDNRSLY